ncbi:MAG: hypothetical protein FWF28_00010 [Micrococcales bacterium]|nr:hypothetical protein [Micrococcales bacterium]
MALLHDAILRPTKAEVLTAWAPTQEWYPSDSLGFEIVGQFRLDDPDGEVGIETLLLADATGAVYHVPLTYRGAPREDERGLIGTLYHSVLGLRWVYDAEADDVYRTVVADTIRQAHHEARLFRQHADGTVTETASTAHAWGTGPLDAAGELALRRLVDAATPDAAAPQSPALQSPALLATWAGHDEPVTLAVLH